MELSTNFTLAEMIKSQTAERKGIDNYDLARWIESNLPFDQLILECYNPTDKNSGWVHCSYVHEPRKETLTYNRDTGYQKGLIYGS